MSKILLYQEATTGVTTSGEQHAFFINENGLPAVKNGSQTIVFGTSGAAFTGSSGSSGANGSIGTSGSSGVSGTSGQDGAPGDTGAAGDNGTSGVSGTSGINGADGASGSSGEAGTAGTSGISYGTSGSSGFTGTAGSSGVSGTNGLTAVGAASKGGSVPLTGFTGDTLVYNVVFASNFANTNYSVSVEYTGEEAGSASGLDPFITNKSVSGFTINTGFAGLDPSLDTIIVDWLAVSQGETGVAGAPGSSGTAGSAGSSGLSYGSSGTSGAAGMNGTSGTSAGGGAAGPSISEELLNVQMLSGTTVNGDNEVLYGFFGNTSHWGYGAYRNYWIAQTYPCTIPVDKKVATAYFPIEVDNTKAVQYHIIIWKNTPGSFYPDERVSLDSFTLSGLTTGYNVIEYDVNFTNDGSYGDDTLFFITIARFDPDGDAHRFRKCVAYYFDIDKMGVFNHTSKNFMIGTGQGVLTTVFNPDWSTVPSTYVPGSSGGIYFGIYNDEAIPFFWNLA
jgi:hypothetical protein